MNVLTRAITVAVTAGLISGTAQAAISDNEIRIGYLADMSGTTVTYPALVVWKP